MKYVKLFDENNLLASAEVICQSETQCLVQLSFEKDDPEDHFNVLKGGSGAI